MSGYTSGFTHADLVTIETAIASGALLVQSADGRRVQYQNVADMLRARDAIRQALTEASAASPPDRMRRVVTVRDF